jgi:hypothetical protein
MQSKHKIIGLTSLVLTTTIHFASATPANNFIDTKNANYTQLFYIGTHGENSTAEGGESGEGGFDATNLKTDDVAFGTALRVIHAHYLIGEKLYTIQDYEKAESFFGHPISEVLIDLQSAFEARNIESPEEEMYALLDIAQQENQLPQLQAGIAKVLAKIEKAFTKITLADKKHQIKNMAAINAELIRRGKLEYFQAIQNNNLGALQDAIGYFDISSVLFEKNKADYSSLNQEKTDSLVELFDNMKPFFKDFQKINQKANHKKLAGLTAKIELILTNLD